MSKKILTIFLLFLIFMFTGCAVKKEVRKIEKTELMMHTVFQIVIYTDLSDASADLIFEGAFKIVRNYEVKYSTTSNDSIVSKLNFSRSADWDTDSIAVLKDALDLSAISGGRFDVTVYPLMKVWGFYDDNGHIPAASEINEILKHVGYRNIKIKGSRVTLSDDVKIDLGGIVKGYTVNQVVKYLQDSGIKAGFADAGGNLKVFGRKPDGSDWLIGIRHPRKSGDLFGTIVLESGKSVATSGDYEQYFITNGIRYFHIMNPFSGYPVRNGVVSASVISESREASDGLSSMFFTIGPDKGLELAEKMKLPVLYIIETNGLLTYTNSSLWNGKFN